MKRLKAFSIVTLVVNTSIAIAQTSLYSTTITKLTIELPEAQLGFPPSDPTPKPRVLITTPALPANCVNGINYLFQITDLDNDTQKQMYATLVSAKINGLPVDLIYTIDHSYLRCRVVAMSLK